MYTVSHYNFGTKQDFSTLDYAKAFARRACFEAAIYFDGKLICRFNPISLSFISC